MTKKYLFVLLLFLTFYLFTFTGCATAPKKDAFLTYKINGVDYFPLVTLCDLKGIDLQYDTFTKSVYLNKDAHKINLRVGDTLALVDGRAVFINYPVRIFQGTVVVPYKFKEQIIDPIFKQTYPVRKQTLQMLKIRKVVIDAGHGGNDPGTIGRTGLREKDVNLDIAKRLSNILRSQGIEVVMTRAADRFIPLSRRVDIANSVNADLFISIHSNANRVRSMKGFEVYYVSSSVNDAKRAYETARICALNLNNAYCVSNSLNLKATLWDMLYTNNRAEAIELSSSICRSMEKNMNARILRIKGARFEVLRGVRMPGVLVEVGFLSNVAEERMLKNSVYRQQIAEGIVQGMEDYAQCAPLLEITKR